MKLYEYEGKRILESCGVTVPKGRLVSTPEQARAAAAEVGGPVVIKVQILATGRGKAGGVKFADTPDQAAEVASQ
ncbi:MAG TPA: ATP-grasp domain-containing protein, partial [Chloroflexota bacterium]|nr:ATP-grasp domain-containing protein [Chloroflexota bacterium]